ncbi:alpha/beta fold hydrolase [Blastococcus deserti]|uniref:Alpha/beta fold hydrolase n=1 Tax=Blastococcus deserti TaxID=2259033 RepID=A0ABW4XHR1_9ACTN
MSDETGHVEVDGVPLSYRIRGHGEPVLLLHAGFVADGMQLLLSAPELEGFRLVAYHRRGYGDSGRVHGPPVTMVRQAEDVAVLLDRLGLRRAHLVGHSFGANVALQVAAAAPDRVGALVLMEPLLGFTLSPEAAAGVTDAAATAMPLFASGDSAGALDAWLLGAFGPGYRDVLDRALPGAWERAVADAPAAFGSEIPSLQGWAFGPPDLARVRAPTLSVVNTGTYWGGFRETHEALLSGVPGAEGAVVPVASHLLQIADPGPVAAVVADFLHRHPLPA